MNGGEIAIVSINAAYLVMLMFKHGESKNPERYDFYKSFFCLIITFSLYYWAGLFRNLL